jgi:hypothetical protein
MDAGSPTPGGSDTPAVAEERPPELLLLLLGPGEGRGMLAGPREGGAAGAAHRWAQCNERALRTPTRIEDAGRSAMGMRSDRAVMGACARHARALICRLLCGALRKSASEQDANERAGTVSVRHPAESASS